MGLYQNLKDDDEEQITFVDSWKLSAKGGEIPIRQHFVKGDGLW
jgi:hypothetical protein